jgi:hypothetical protein
VVTPFPYSFEKPANQRSAAEITALGLQPGDLNTNKSLFAEQLISPAVGYPNELPVLRRSSANQVTPHYEYQQTGKTGEEFIGIGGENRVAYDGGRNDNIVSPYSTYIADPEGTGWIGIDLGGRLFRVEQNGTVTTIAGTRSSRTLPAGDTARDELVGTFQNNLKFFMPVDLVADPRDPKILYVADTGNNRIAKVDLHQSPPVISTYAGISWKMGTVAPAGGYVDAANASAVFNRPYSIVALSDGTLFVADMGNNAIRKIATDGTVSSVFGSRTSFNESKLVSPQTMRLDSQNRLIVASERDHSVWRLDLASKQATNIYTFTGDAWIWLDVDRYGNMGPKDDIMVAIAVHGPGPSDFIQAGNAYNTLIFRISADGTRRINMINNNAIHYPWAIAIHDSEARMIVSGFGSTNGLLQFRPRRATDPVYGNYDDKFAYTVDGAKYANGQYIHNWGTAAGFPPNSRPSFKNLVSEHGYGFVGARTFDELSVMTDAQIATYIQAGMGGLTPRPELTGNDLRDYIYYIRRIALQGDLTKIVPGPDAADKVVPVISAVQAVKTGDLTAQVTWTTSEPTIGLVQHGVVSGKYHNSSAFETGYTTTHTAVLDGLAPNKVNHFHIRSKDVAGNFAAGTNLTLDMRVAASPLPSPVISEPPAPSPVVPTSLVKAVQSGNWTATTTWEGGVVPTADKDVEIPSGVTVTYDKVADDNSSAEAKEVFVKSGGKLVFSRSVSTRLDLNGSLSVLAGGVLDVGTSNSPIPADKNVKIGFNVVNDRAFSSSDSTSPTFQVPRDPNLSTWHPEDTGLYIVGENARATFVGNPKPKIWTKLSASVSAGATELKLADVPEGWRVGDTVLITSSSKNSAEQETRTIKSIDGNTITLNSGVSSAHEVVLYAYNQATKKEKKITDAKNVSADETLITLAPEVALLTQNVTVVSNQVTAETPNRRAHLMMAQGGVASLYNVELRDLGPRAKFGRYPLHIHMIGALGSQVTVQGVSIWSSISDPTNKWIAIHGTQGVTVKDTVGFNAQGRGYLMEDAVEYNNTIENTLGVLVHNPEELAYTVDTSFPEPRTAGAVFWVREGNTYKNNVAVGGDGVAGFWVTPNVSSSAPSTTTFEHNEAHSTKDGLQLSDATKNKLASKGNLLWQNETGLRTGVHEITAATVADSVLADNTAHNNTPGAAISNSIFIPAPVQANAVPTITLDAPSEIITVSPGDTLTLKVTARDENNKTLLLEILNLAQLLPGALFE